MKYILLFSILFSNTAFSNVKLFFQPATIFDSECQQRTGFKIDSLWQKELSEKLSRFQSKWDKKANAIVQESELAAGRRFIRKEFSVGLTLCKWTPMGDPVFIISVRPYLDGPARADEKIKQPMDLNIFASMTHHELLHSLVDNITNAEFSKSSPMVEKYKDESFKVLVHLHLMAIQKAVYEKLNDNTLLKSTDQLYSFIGGDYKRAWDIINLEGTEPFLRELKAFNHSGK